MSRRLSASVHHERMEKANGKPPASRLCFLATLSDMFWIMIFYNPEQSVSYSSVPSNPTDFGSIRSARTAKNEGAVPIETIRPASTGSISLHPDCRKLSLWTNMCKFTSNAGLGPPLENAEGVFSNTGWYATNQFAVDVIFNNRTKQYECLTKDSSIAAAIFVPFYAGFDIALYLWGYNISVRDSSSLELVNWLMKRPEWSVMRGRDHFLVAGRITWDFRRLTDSESD
ncbi:hypothetical protein OPV22_001589 [Ensete ventricosum]|uniref:Exostosin GT47 domain-containing protein n=1 Tax=Ensete ventricosum TaxID=4639 RepID=A0AAV8RRJ7_ENSVE|nr:hypothetical protein OPV22_001589 [Ensete ventricosum]